MDTHREALITQLDLLIQKTYALDLTKIQNQLEMALLLGQMKTLSDMIMDNKTEGPK